MMSTFDPHLDFGLIEGNFTNVAVIDPVTPIPANVQNLVIDPKSDFEIKVEWTLAGFLVPLWLQALDSLGSDWQIRAYAESMGPGQEIQIASGSEPVGAVTDPKTYSHTLTVPAGTLDSGNPGGPSGVYKLVVTAFLNSTLGAPGYDITGFHEGPMIRIEDPI